RPARWRGTQLTRADKLLKHVVRAALKLVLQRRHAQHARPKRRVLPQAIEKRFGEMVDIKGTGARCAALCQRDQRAKMREFLQGVRVACIVVLQSKIGKIDPEI